MRIGESDASNRMKAPPRYTITIHGRTDQPIRPDRWPALQYLIERLLTGETVADTAFKEFGLTVFVDEDCDQGD